VTVSATERSEVSAPAAWNLGVRARLLLAFFGISAFAALAAAAGIYAFREVGGRLDVVDTRIPPTLSALELSRSAERIIAAAPALLAAADRPRRDEVKAELAAEVARLNGKLVELKNEGAQALPLEKIEPVVSLLTSSLSELDGLVERRLETSEGIAALRRSIFQTSAQVQRLLAPWLKVLDNEISALVAGMQKAPPDQRGDETQRLASLLQLQRLTETAQRQVSATVDMLAEASTTEQVRRLPILDFQLGLALRDLLETAAGLDPKLRPLFLQQAAKLREFAEGPNAVAEARKLELALVSEGAKQLAVTAKLSAQLSAAVDGLGSAAKQDIGQAISDALSVQRLSTRALIVLVVLSLLTSVLIVWLYVGRNIVRRLTALSDGMLAIAGGRLRTPVTAEGADEIAAMGRAVEVFRRNAIELEHLLEERKEAAIRLEHVVKERTRDLSESLEQQTATAEILRAISTSPNDAQRVFETIVRNAVSLCGGLFANVFRFDGELLHFVTSYNVGPSYVGMLEAKYPMPPDSSQVSGRVLLTKSVVRLEDAFADPDYDQRFPRALGWRRMLGVPMLREGIPVGVIVVGWAAPGPVPAAQEDLLRTFADQAVIAIENTRLFDEIQHKSRQLEIANRYKSHFLASASHDLRQPLHALNLFIAQLRTESDAERDRLIGRIEAAVGSMNELFEALLDMSKLEAGILEPDLTEFPVDRLLKRIETTFADAARGKGLRLTLAPSNAWVRSDFVLLERILFNLVSNAVRYTARGGLVVGTRRRGERLRIDVCDTGPGIPEERQQDVFAEFYQLADADRRGGLGLGLAIVDRLGRLLGHPIALRSRPGRGSRFSVSVPLVSEAAGIAEAPVAPAIADPAHGKLVLVIDDDPLVIEGMSGILRSWGCRILGADSEETALAAVQRQWPDLIIADYRLADGNTGIHAIERLRDAAGFPIPAFLISGDTAPERLREASANGYQLLHKPVPPMRLRTVLNQFMTARGASRAAE
jgi:signal transduction histidine kinase/HAMP domain-containing protein